MRFLAPIIVRVQILSYSGRCNFFVAHFLFFFLWKSGFRLVYKPQHRRIRNVVLWLGKHAILVLLFRDSFGGDTSLKL